MTIDESSAVIDAAAKVGPAVVKIDDRSAPTARPVRRPRPGRRLGRDLRRRAAGSSPTATSSPTPSKLTVELKDGRQFAGTRLRHRHPDRPRDRQDRRRPACRSRRSAHSRRPQDRPARGRDRQPARHVLVLGHQRHRVRQGPRRSPVDSGKRIIEPDPDRRGDQPRQLGRAAGRRRAASVVGINTAVATDSSGIGFAIPIDIAQPIMDQARRAARRSPGRGSASASCRSTSRSSRSATSRSTTARSSRPPAAPDPAIDARQPGRQGGPQGRRRRSCRSTGSTIDQEHPLDALLVQFAPERHGHARRPPRRQDRDDRRHARDAARGPLARARRGSARPAPPDLDAGARSVPPSWTCGLRTRTVTSSAGKLGQDLVRDRLGERLDQVEAASTRRSGGRSRTPGRSRSSARGRRTGRPAGGSGRARRRPRTAAASRCSSGWTPCVPSNTMPSRMIRSRHGRRPLGPARRPPAAEDRVGDARRPHVLADVVDAHDVDAGGDRRATVVASVASTRWSAGRSSSRPRVDLREVPEQDRPAEDAQRAEARRAARGCGRASCRTRTPGPRSAPSHGDAGVERPGRSPRCRSATTSATTFAVARLGAVVHQHDRHAARGGEPDHRRVVGDAPDVVEEVGAGVEGGLRDGRARRVDRDRGGGQRRRDGRGPPGRPAPPPRRRRPGRDRDGSRRRRRRAGPRPRRPSGAPAPRRPRPGRPRPAARRPRRSRA